jgi:hypothetical protein
VKGHETVRNIVLERRNEYVMVVKNLHYEQIVDVCELEKQEVKLD